MSFPMAIRMVSTDEVRFIEEDYQIPIGEGFVVLETDVSLQDAFDLGRRIESEDVEHFRKQQTPTAADPVRGYVSAFSCPEYYEETYWGDHDDFYWDDSREGSICRRSAEYYNVVDIYEGVARYWYFGPHEDCCGKWIPIQNPAGFGPRAVIRIFMQSAYGIDVDNIHNVPKMREGGHGY